MTRISIISNKKQNVDQHIYRSELEFPIGRLNNRQRLERKQSILANSLFCNSP